MEPSPIDLTTLDDVKSYGEIASNKDDDLIQAAITAFSQFVLNKTGRETLSGVQTFTEVYDGNGSGKMMLRNSPIISISSLLIDGAPVQASSGYGSAGYYIEQTKRSIAIRNGSAGSFSSTYYPGTFGLPFYFRKGAGNIQIIYLAGFASTATNEQDTITAQTITLQEQGWAQDLGVVFYPSLIPLAPVASNPAAGQYSVLNGLYAFNTADNGKVVAVSYLYAGGAPPDLEFAARQAVAINYKRKSYRDHASKSMSAGGGTGTTSYRDWKYPPEVAEVIQNYRRYAPI